MSLQVARLPMVAVKYHEPWRIDLPRIDDPCAGVARLMLDQRARELIAELHVWSSCTRITIAAEATGAGFDVDIAAAKKHVRAVFEGKA